MRTIPRFVFFWLISLGILVMVQGCAWMGQLSGEGQSNPGEQTAGDDAGQHGAGLQGGGQLGVGQLGVGQLGSGEQGSGAEMRPATPSDPTILSVIEPYRDHYNNELSQPISILKAPARFAKPEGSLGNLVADALRYRAAEELRKYVHIGVIDEGSFRLHLDEGPITLGEMLEFMPYENHLTILELPGSSVKQLADEIAALGGGPISGMRFQIRDDRATALLVDAEPIEEPQRYLVATSSWIANGGGPFTALHNPISREDLTMVAIRDLYIDYLRDRDPLEPTTDGRIR
ncbi:MAG: hypothetical protein DA446_05145 [Bacteroidetes bacterium]|jgi:2',3'-cyclic-nucleotide 2'-phosphodiesterase (5'-nucleotidase family)|nr:MAG: hypothetical protein DA446_05145 [Bacteroidota bacterium]